MQISVKELQKYLIQATDGEIGRVKDLLFDDRSWHVRYLVADTRKWLPGRKVLVGPPSVDRARMGDRRLPVGHSKEEIRNSPPLEADEPVSRRYEKKWFDYYRLPYYWVGPAGVGTVPTPVPLRDSPLPSEKVEPPKPDTGPRPEETTHLRSADEVIGYRIGAVDGDIGHLEDLVVDLINWNVLFTVVDTRNWLPGRKVALLPASVQQISWAEGTVQVDRTRAEIEKAPAYEPGQDISDSFAAAVEQFYGIPPRGEEDNENRSS